MPKMRAQITYTLEYEADPADYDIDTEGLGSEEIAQTLAGIDEGDIEQWGGEWLWANPNSTVSWEVAVVES